MICHICRNSESEGQKSDGSNYTTCEKCRLKYNSNRKNIRQTQCIKCGVFHCDKKENGYPYKMCQNCRASAVAQNHKYQNENIAGVCSVRKCKKPTKNGHTLCEECRLKNKDRAQKCREKRKLEGLCLECGIKRPNSQTQYCYKCILKRHARQALGGAISRWKEIGMKLVKQKFLCAYSGRKICLGKNTSLDHKIPISNGGTHESDNLQWVHIDVNFMKGKLMPNEFLSLISDISNFQGQKS